jgi:hypothetical protein
MNAKNNLVVKKDPKGYAKREGKAFSFCMEIERALDKIFVPTCSEVTACG